MSIKDRLKRIDNYKNIDFFSSDGIGIIARGPSVCYLKNCCDKFDNCFLAGEFNNAFSNIGKYIYNKNIVLTTMQPFRYMTKSCYCKKFNIENLQVGLLKKSKDYKICENKYPYLKVTGIEQEHFDILKRVNSPNAVFSTGVFPIICSVYFNPKNIYILGIDFYNENENIYYVHEDMDINGDDEVKEENIFRFRDGMIKTISNICDEFKNIDFHIYTTYRGIVSKKNLEIIYV